MSEVTRYDISTDRRVEVTQDYFDELQAQFGAMLIHYSKNHPETYNEFIQEYRNRKTVNV